VSEDRKIEWGMGMWGSGAVHEKWSFMMSSL